VLHSNYESLEWEGFGGGESKLKSFNKALNRYGAEYEVVGNTVHIKPLIGRDSQFQFRYKLNASNIVQEVDATEFYTYAKGYGDYGHEDAEDGEGETTDWQDAKLIREYTSPLANIPSIGIRHAPPVKDGRITKKSTMDARLRTLVDESAQISVSADIQDLRDQGYSLGQPKIGDRVFLIDESIGFNGEVRIVDMTTVRDWRGRIIDIQITFGTEGILRTHQTNLQSAVDNIEDIVSCNKILAYSVLDNAVKRATEVLQGTLTEISFTNRGIFAIDKKDPNKQVVFNAGGIGVSNDGGATYPNAITGDGINANFITAGTMLADRIAGGVLSSINGNTEFNLNKGDLFMEKANFTLGSGAMIRFSDPGNRIYFRLKDPKGSKLTRSSGVGVGRSINNRFPFVFMGTSSTRTPQASDAGNFSGFIANVRQREFEDSIGNSVVGHRFHVRDKAVDFDKGFLFHIRSSRPYLSGMNSSRHNYDLGGSYNNFDRIYVRHLRNDNGYFTFRNQSSGYTNQGFRMDTSYGNDDQLYFRGIHSDDYHSLGKPNGWRFRYVYLRYQPDVSSDERLKNHITPIEHSIDLVKKIEPISFRYKLTNKDLELKQQGKQERGLDDIQYGFSAQQVISVIDELGITDQSLVNLNDDNYYSMQMTQLIAVIVDVLQYILKKIEENDVEQ